MKLIRLKEVSDSKVTYGILGVSDLMSVDPPVDVIVSEIEKARSYVSQNVEDWQVNDILEELSKKTGWRLDFLDIDAEVGI